MHPGLLQILRTYQALIDATDEKTSAAIMVEVQNAVSIKKFYIAQDSYILYEIELQLLMRGLVRPPIRGFQVEGAARFFGYTGRMDQLLELVVLDLAIQFQEGFFLAHQDGMNPEEVWGNINHLREFVAGIVKYKSATMVGELMGRVSRKTMRDGDGADVDLHDRGEDDRVENRTQAVVPEGVSKESIQDKTTQAQIQCLSVLAAEARTSVTIDIALLYLSARERLTEAVMANDTIAMGELLQNQVDQLIADVDMRETQSILDVVFRGRESKQGADKEDMKEFGMFRK